MKKVLPVFLLCFLFSNLQIAQNLQGLYVNDFKKIIGNVEKENALLQFAEDNQFNYLLLYNLYYIDKNLFDLEDPATAVPLAQFIEKAKTQYGIQQVGAVGEKFSSFKSLTAYQVAHQGKPNQQFDVFNIEFEFWNNKLVANYYCDHYLQNDGLSCDNEGAFTYYSRQLEALTELTKRLGIQSEVYIGKPTKSQSQFIGNTIDRVLVHYYRRSDTYNNGNSIYNYHNYRLKYLAPKEGVLTILPIFSARSYHMGPWLADNPKEKAMKTWTNGQKGYEAAKGRWKEHLQIGGSQWYRYTDVQKYVDQFQDGNTLASNRDYGEQEPLLPDAAEIETFKDIKIFPNPTNERIKIRLQKEMAIELSLYSLLGKEVLKKSYEATPLIEMDISAIPNGVYFLYLRNKYQRVGKKIVIGNMY